MTDTPLQRRRLAALIRKESLQIRRDPSTWLIAFLLPVVMLVLFAYAVSLDIRKVPVAVVLESDGGAAQSLAAAYAAAPHLRGLPVRDRREAHGLLRSARIRAILVVPQDFDARIRSGRGPFVQVFTDGSQPNTATFAANMAQSVLALWRGAPPAAVTLEPRFWYNAELESRRFLVPGAIAIVMTMIGTMLTALVVAREWERGTMEALFATPASVAEILLGKLLPYFALGLGACVLSALMAIHVFGVPLRGSWGALLLLSSAFLVPALGQGLMISALARNQFVAAQVALFSGFLPAFLLSGFIFEIDSMPLPIRAITHLVPARWFVSSLQTVFLAGDLWTVFLPHILIMLAIGAGFFFIALSRTRKTLDV